MLCVNFTVWKVSKYGVISGPYFSAFGVNTERYEVSLRIHSECGKIRTRNNSVFGHLFICVVCEWLPDLLPINQVRSLNLIQVTCKTCSIRKSFSPDLWLCISADISRVSCFLCWCSLWKINHQGLLLTETSQNYQWNRFLRRLATAKVSWKLLKLAVYIAAAYNLWSNFAANSKMAWNLIWDT